MVGVKSVTMDGEPICVFSSAIYIFESSTEDHLDVEMIVSEVSLRKYKDRESLIVEIELEDGRVISSFMFLKSLPGKLPRLHLFCEIDKDHDYDYDGILRVSEDDLAFPDIEEGITLEDIRKVEMPNEKITLKLNLPIDQVEWLKMKKNKELNQLFKEFLYEKMSL
jgi:hypothetical protein